MFPRWLSWIFVFVLLYMVYAASQTQRAGERGSATILPAITEKDYPELAKATDVEAWKRKLDPHYASVMNCEKPETADAALALKIMQDSAGDGAVAKCGDVVTLELTVWNSRGAADYKGTIDLDLGSRQLASGLDYALLGIASGGVRTIILPPSAQARNKVSKLPEALLKAFATGKDTQTVIVTAKRVK